MNNVSSKTGEQPALEESRQVVPSGPPGNSGVSLRVVFCSLLMAATFGYIIPIIDFRVYNWSWMGGSNLPVGAMGALFILLAGNCLLKVISRRLARDWAFRRNEVLTFYITALFAALVPGFGSANFFIPHLMSSFYYATRENGWLRFLEPNLRPWFTPALQGGYYSAANRHVVQDWYTGTAQGASWPWQVWLMPLAIWAALIFAVYGMLACLGVLLRAQWAENEALAFPLLRIPLSIMEDKDSSGNLPFLRNPLTWVGIGIAAFIQLMNGLHILYPDVPSVPLEIATGALFSEAPWNQIGDLQIRIFPLVAGVSFLLTSEVSFSLWFFFLFTKLEYMGAYYLGFSPAIMPSPPWAPGLAKAFVSYQQIGAFFGFVTMAMWTARGHLRFVFKRATKFRRQPAPLWRQDPCEALPYPVAFWGFLACFLAVVAWTCVAGVRFDLALVLWITYLVLSLGITRVVAEGGLVVAHAGWSPMWPLAHLVGAGPGHWINAASATPGAFITSGLMFDLRGSLLPSFLHAFKLAHDNGIHARKMLALIFACIALATFVSWHTILTLGYKYGALQLPGMQWWARNGSSQPAMAISELLNGLQDSYAANWLWFTVGVVATWGMMEARSRLMWFPFHPIGYIMCTPYAIHVLWFSVFVAWLAKTLIMRFGGHTAYRAAIPFFMGLALGDVAATLFWVALNAIQGHTGGYTPL